MSIKTRLRFLIAERETKEGRRLSLARLARETNLTENTLRNLANNTTQRFDAPVLAALCAYFGVSIGELLVYGSEHETMNTLPILPSTPDEAIAVLEEKYPGIIQRMPPEFTTHKFIQKLARRYPHEYLGLLHTYYQSDSPFRDAHSLIGRRLRNFSHLVTLVQDDYDSRDIFGTKSKAALWRKVK